MGYWDNFGSNLAESSSVAAKLRNAEIQKLQIQAAQDEMDRNKKKLSDAIGTPETEANFRSNVVNVPVGPLNRPQSNALEATQVQSAGINPIFKNMTFGQAKEIAPFLKATETTPPKPNVYVYRDGRDKNTYNTWAEGRVPYEYAMDKPEKPTTGIPSDIRTANDLRKEFINRPEVKEYQTISTQVNAMDSLLKNALAGNMNNQVALDQGLVTMYNKLTDPQSVVRESEYARTPSNLPVLNRIEGAIQKIGQGGAGLTDDDRKALVLGAKIIANERGKQFNNVRGEYSTLAGKYQIDPSLAIGTLPQFNPYKIEGQNKPGGKIMVDKNGVKAIVYPDGTFEEIK